MAPLSTYKTSRPMPELEPYPTDPAHLVSSGVARESTEARPVPGHPRLHPGGSFSCYPAVWYPRLTLIRCGSSPSATLALRSPFPPLSNSLCLCGFLFSSTLATSPFSARLSPSTPRRPFPGLLTRVMRYPQA